MEFYLMRPQWLWCLLPAALLALLLWRERRSRGNWHSVISADLLPYLVGEKAGDKARNFLPLILAAWALAALAAAGPSWQKIPLPVHQKQDALVILLDLSYSLKSTDLAPSRIDRARQKILDLLQQCQEGQTGLIAYAGDAHIVTPLTDDIDTIANLLPALNPDMMPVPGSSPVSAVEQGLELLRSAGIRGGRILLVTDGVTPDDGDTISTLARNSGVQLGVMGIGTATGAPIPMPRGGFLKDSDGSIVMPRLDESTLHDLATDAGGRYRRMQINDSDLSYLLAENTLLTSDATIALDRQADTWEDQGYLFLPPLLLIALLLFRRGVLLTLAPILLVCTPDQVMALEWNDLWLTRDQQGQRALAKGDNAGASQLFKHPDWAGTAAYREGDYENAVEHFNQTESADSLYNRGNALARSGELDSALEAYRESLALEPDRPDAQDNIALLEQLQQQQEQQEQQQQQGDEQKNEEQQDQEGQQQNQQQGQQEQDQQQSQAGDQQDGEQQDGGQNDQEQQSRDNQEQPSQEPQEGQPDSGEEQEDNQESEQIQSAAQDEQPGEEQGQAPVPVDSSEQERDQAMEQWLRRVPDDPSGLLREKFRYESERRQAQGEKRDNEQYW